MANFGPFEESALDVQDIKEAYMDKAKRVRLDTSIIRQVSCAIEEGELWSVEKVQRLLDTGAFSATDT